MKTLTTFTLALAVLVLGAAANAAYISIDDFESYALSGINPQSMDWSGAADVVTDPADSGNQVLSYTGSNVSHYYNGSDLNIADGTTGTLFFRARIEGGTDPDFGMGMSDFSGPSSWGAYEAQLTWQNDGSSVGVRDGDDTTDSATTTDDAWYNVWMVINNTSDTYDVYIQSDDDSNFSSRTKITTSGASDFRNKPDDGLANNDLVSFFLNTNSGTNAPAYIDDIFLDASGENLVNPIPEPATLALLGLGGAVMLAGRKRRA